MGVITGVITGVLLLWYVTSMCLMLVRYATSTYHMQAKQSDAQELTSGQASTMARNEQVIDTLTGIYLVVYSVCCMLPGVIVCL